MDLSQSDPSASLCFTTIDVHFDLVRLLHELSQQAFVSFLPDLAINSDSVVSSTNLCIIHDTRRLSTRVMNDTILEACQHPSALIRRHLTNLNTLTPMVQERTYPPDDGVWQVNLATRTVWSIWSNALAQSTKTGRTDLPSSTALCQ